MENKPNKTSKLLEAINNLDIRKPKLNPFLLKLVQVSKKLKNGINLMKIFQSPLIKMIQPWFTSALILEQALLK